MLVLKDGVCHRRAPHPQTLSRSSGPPIRTDSMIRITCAPLADGIISPASSACSSLTGPPHGHPSSQLLPGTKGQWDAALLRVCSPGENPEQAEPDFSCLHWHSTAHHPLSNGNRRNSTQRNVKSQPKPKANRAGSQQGPASMQYVAACCVLLNTKHLTTEEPSPKL